MKQVRGSVYPTRASGRLDNDEDIQSTENKTKVPSGRRIESFLTRVRADQGLILYGAPFWPSHRLRLSRVSYCHGQKCHNSNIRRNLNRYQGPPMNRNTHALTLRIDQQLDDLISDASYDQRVSKSQWIREALFHRFKSEGFTNRTRSNHQTWEKR
jgi:hypothetical protein